jgi:hypothetical protein
MPSVLSTALNALLRIWRHSGTAIDMLVARLRAVLLRQPHYIREVISGDVDLQAATKVAVFAHYDAAGQVHGYVLQYLQGLSAAGYTIVFVSNSPLLPAASRALLQPLVGAVLWRHNLGYDFGAYKDGIAHLGDLSRLEALLIANDSTYGPFHQLSEQLDKVGPKVADVVAMTDSHELDYHLQSYFIVFYPVVLRHPAFLAFWQKLAYVNHKQYVIWVYELGLTRLLVRLQFRCQALFAYADSARLVSQKLALVDTSSAAFQARPEREQQLHHFLLQRLAAGRPVNALHFFWSELLVELRCPLLKRELLLSNPRDLPGLDRWREQLASVSSYDSALIDGHLAVLAERPVDGQAG